MTCPGDPVGSLDTDDTVSTGVREVPVESAEPSGSSRGPQRLETGRSAAMDAVSTATAGAFRQRPGRNWISPGPVSEWKLSSGSRRCRLSRGCGDPWRTGEYGRRDAGERRAAADRALGSGDLCGGGKRGSHTPRSAPGWAVCARPGRMPRWAGQVVRGTGFLVGIPAWSLTGEPWGRFGAESHAARKGIVGGTPPSRGAFVGVSPPAGALGSRDCASSPRERPVNAHLLPCFPEP